MKIYTKKGDDGTTGLLFGGRISKDDLRTDTYGTSDEAVAVIGLARAFGLEAEGLSDLLLEVQRQLFIVGAELATSPQNVSKLKPGSSKVTDDMVEWLEKEIDRMTGEAPLPEYFIVPGASSASAALDVARAVVRRAERGAVAMSGQGMLPDPVVLRYLNRLSDFLFSAARYEEAARGTQAPPSRE